MAGNGDFTVADGDWRWWTMEIAGGAVTNDTRVYFFDELAHSILLHFKIMSIYSHRFLRKPIPLVSIICI